ncbi:hypothetical protein [Hyphomicrobium sp. DY-1]|uniref:hypothetical protein n=1 Tax=Hyphomicrobium sp. DY-1 TaxID=3075650 RepID=UPI0039C0456C
MVETLGQALDLGWKVKAKCAAGKREGMKTVRACVHGYALDLQTLVWTRGRDFPLSWLGSRMRCPRCGSRQVTVFFEPPGNAGRGRGPERPAPAWIRMRDQTG